MKLCCFVILVFISVIFTVGGEWGKEGIVRVNSLPTPSTNQNEDSYSQQLLTERLHTDKQLLKRYIQNIQGEPEPEEHPGIKHPNPQNQTNPTNQAKQNVNNKGKDVDTQNAQDQNADNANNTAKKLEEEAQTISRVIVVLGSLGASLLLVAIAIAVLYWKVRRQQKLVKSVKLQEDNNFKRNNDDDNNIIHNNNNNENGSGMKNDGGGGVGEGENIIASDDSESLYTSHITSEKSNIINSNPSGGVNNNGFDNRVVGDKLDNEPSESPCIHHNIQQQLSPSAPPAEKFEDNNLNIIGSNSNLSPLPSTAPPAYTPTPPPTAPPIYALPHIPILYTDENIYQQPNLHNSETNHNGGTFIGMPWYAAGPTSQINPPTNNTPYQQSNPTIIQPNPSSSNLNSSFNSHENNDGNDKRQTI